ncbi:MAG: DNA-binding response regulator [Bacteroidetes bacterium 4484_276]|nr:MAG: DNA-binding response regulator [Bacteroidetes bacterium 4484_276]OYT13989.1 MAG: DNA-binding response regulator [Bacteroidetes bacterium 4572_114]
MSVLIVDDEFLALKLLEDYVGRLPFLEIVDKVKSPIKAIEILNQKPIDLLFLDIQMPTLSGTNLLRTLKYKPVTIFTTAYSEHAVEAFELDAVDYLLKPFSFERFLQAVNKAREQITLQQKAHSLSGAGDAEMKDYITFKADGRHVKVHYNQILFIEGLKEYVKIVCEDQRYIVLESMKNLEEELPSGLFLRVHKSYIASISKIKSLYGNMLVIDEHEIPVSRDKKEEVLKIVFG